MNLKLFITGKTIRFLYPEANYRHVRRRWKVRRMLVQDVIDTRLCPVPSKFLTADPLLKRSRHLVRGIDLDTGHPRSFYYGSMRNIEEIRISPSSVVMAEIFQTSYSVAVVESAEENPTYETLPDEFQILDVLAKGVAECFAQAIADKANLDATAAQSQMKRWAVVFPPGYVTQFLPLL
jgi:hypothetical protein